MGSINVIAFVVPKLAKVWNMDFIEKICEIKRTVTFELLVELG